MISLWLLMELIDVQIENVSEFDLAILFHLPNTTNSYDAEMQ